jgi:superfamily II DNA/RNA helicase
MQVTEVCKGISHFCKLKVYGLDKRRSEKEEIEKLNSGVDVLVITLDRLNKMRDHIFLSYVSFLVIDELDTLLDAACADSL